MSYQLVVSEKPSVGAAYAKVLGATNRQDGYWEGNGYLVSWCMPEKSCSLNFLWGCANDWELLAPF